VKVLQVGYEDGHRDGSDMWCGSGACVECRAEEDVGAQDDRFDIAVSGLRC